MMMVESMCWILYANATDWSYKLSLVQHNTKNISKYWYIYRILIIVNPMKTECARAHTQYIPTKIKRNYQRTHTHSHKHTHTTCAHITQRERKINLTSTQSIPISFYLSATCTSLLLLGMKKPSCVIVSVFVCEW